MYMGSVDCSKYEHCSEPTYIGSTPRSLLHNPADVGDIGPGGGPGGHLDHLATLRCIYHLVDDEAGILVATMD